MLSSPRVPIPEFLNPSLAVISYNGGCEAANDKYDIRNVLAVDAETPHCSDLGSNFDLLLHYCGHTNCGATDNGLTEHPNGFILTHIVLRQPFQVACTCPIRTGMIWVHDTKPDIGIYTKSFDNFSMSRTKGASDGDHPLVTQSFQQLPPGSPTPVCYFDFGTKEDEIRIQVRPWRPGRWVHIKIISSLCSNVTSGNVDIGFIGLVGFHGSQVKFDTQRVWHNLKDVPEKLGVTKKKLQRFNRLHFDLVDYLHNRKALILAHSPNPQDNAEETVILDAVQRVAEKGKFRHKLLFFHGSVQDALFQQFIELSIGAERFAQRDTTSPFLFVMDITSRSDGHVIFDGPKEALLQPTKIQDFCKAVVKSKAPIFIRSAPRPPNDRHPEFPELMLFTSRTFKELVINSKGKDVLVMVSAPWSTPCIIALQMLVMLAKLMKDVPGIEIGILDLETNDYRILGYFPELSIPIIKLFRAKRKDQPLLFDDNRNLPALIRFLHGNSRAEFDKKKLVQKAKKLTTLGEINPKLETLIREATSDLTVMQKADISTEVGTSIQNRITELRRLRTDCEDTIIKQDEMPSEIMLTLGAKMEEFRGFLQPLKDEADKIRCRNVHHIGSVEEFSRTIASGLVICKFTANWCLPCKRIAPVFAEYSLEFPEVQFVELDIEQLPDVARQYRVQAYPTFKFFRNGAEVDEMQGSDAESLRTCIEKNRRCSP